MDIKVFLTIIQLDYLVIILTEFLKNGNNTVSDIFILTSLRLYTWKKKQKIFFIKNSTIWTLLYFLWKCKSWSTQLASLQAPEREHFWTSLFFNKLLRDEKKRVTQEFFRQSLQACILSQKTTKRYFFTKTINLL